MEQYVLLLLFGSLLLILDPIIFTEKTYKANV